MATAKEITVPAADPRTFKPDSPREFLSSKGDPVGDPTEQLAQAPLAPLSHCSPRWWRKWTWHSGGWWQDSSLEPHILKVYKKITGGWKQRLVMQNRLLLKSEINVYETEKKGKKKNPNQTKQLNLVLITNWEEFHSWGFEGLRRSSYAQALNIRAFNQQKKGTNKSIWGRHLPQTMALISEGF